MPKVEYDNPKLVIEGKSGSDYIELTAYGIRSVAKCERIYEDDRAYAVKGYVEDVGTESKLEEQCINKVHTIYPVFMILGLAYLVWAGFFGDPLYLYTDIANMIRGTYLVGMLLIIFATCLMRYTKTAKFHSAEHMAIRAYELYRTLDIDIIASQPKEHEHCGMRFAVLIGIKLQAMLFFFLPINNWYFLGSLTFQFTLWVVFNYVLFTKFPESCDPIKNKFVMSISMFLQKHFFTRTPSRKELETAQFALVQLVYTVKAMRIAS